jgi:hypothetical protein
LDKQVERNDKRPMTNVQMDRAEILIKRRKNPDHHNSIQNVQSINIGYKPYIHNSKLPAETIIQER